MKKQIEALADQELWEVSDLAEAAQRLIGPTENAALERLRRTIAGFRRVCDLEQLIDTVQAIQDERHDRRRQKAEAARAAEKQKNGHGNGSSIGGWSLQQEGVKCGKDACACAKGELHGPYWYGYRTIAGRVRKKYFGVDKPTAAKLAEVDAGLGKGAVDQAEQSPKKRSSR